jgi:hypothetical protein
MKPSSRSKQLSTRIVEARCSRCDLTFDAHFWGELELVDRIASERVRAFVTSWADDAAIEVRRCACGQIMARTRRAQPGGAVANSDGSTDDVARTYHRSAC